MGHLKVFVTHSLLQEPLAQLSTSMQVKGPGKGQETFCPGISIKPRKSRLISAKNQEFHPKTESAAAYGEAGNLPETCRKPARHFPVLGNPGPREIFTAQAPPA